MLSWKKNLPLVLSVAGFYAFLELVCKVTCPIQYLTGISCAGCGMSRAWFAVLRLDWKAAFAYHPLFFLPAVWAVCWLFQDHLPRTPRKGIAIVSAAALLAVYFYRMLRGGQDIVVFHPETGLIWRCVLLLTGR